MKFLELVNRRQSVRRYQPGNQIPREVLDRCLEAAREMGYGRIYLETLDNMFHARHLFEKYGFRYLDTPLGETGHYGCTMWAIRDL